MSAPVIEITEDEYTRCGEHVKQLETCSRRGGQDHAKGGNRRTPEELWRDDMNGHCGQIALCRYLGIDWQAAQFNTFISSPRIAGLFDVRTTTWGNGHLILADLDQLERRCYVLITGNVCQPPRLLTLRGYIWGHDAYRAEFHRPTGRRNTWWIPQHALRPFTTEVQAKMIDYINQGTTA